MDSKGFNELELQKAIISGLKSQKSYIFLRLGGSCIHLWFQGPGPNDQGQ